MSASIRSREGEARRERRAVVDEVRHAADRVGARDEAAVRPCDQPVETHDHPATRLAGELQSHANRGRLGRVPGLMVGEEHGPSRRGEGWGNRYELGRFRCDGCCDVAATG